MNSTALFSPVLSAANNIVGSNRSLTKKAKDYQSFVYFLETSNKDLAKIKLPTKKKIERLSLNDGLLGGFGAGAAALLGISLLAGGVGFDLVKQVIPVGKITGFLAPVLIGGAGLGIAANVLKNSIPKAVGKMGGEATKVLEGGIEAGKGLRTGSGILKGGNNILRAAKGAAPVGGKLFGAFTKAIPGIGAVASFMSAKDRDKKGDKFGSMIDNITGGLDAFEFAAPGLAAAALLIPPPAGEAVAGAILLSSQLAAAGSIGLSATNFIRDITGQSDKEEEKNKSKGKNGTDKTDDDKIKARLKEQERKQREAASKKITFTDITNKFDKVVSKFESFAGGMSTVISGKKPGQTGQEDTGSFQEPITYPPSPTPTDPYKGPISGDTFFPLPGGQEGTESGQQFGAPRTGHTHEGLDLVKFSGDANAPVVAYKTGKVISVMGNGSDIENTGIAIDHGGGLITRYFHLNSSVKVGDIVYGGQQIGTLIPWIRNGSDQTHLHFEIRPNNVPVNPLQIGTGKNRIPSPLSVEDAKRQSENSNNNQTLTAVSGAPTSQGSSVGDIIFGAGHAAYHKGGLLGDDRLPVQGATDPRTGVTESFATMHLIEAMQKIVSANPKLYPGIGFHNITRTTGAQGMRGTTREIEGKGKQFVELHLDESGGGGRSGVISRNRTKLDNNLGSLFSFFPQNFKSGDLAIPDEGGTIVELGAIDDPSLRNFLREAKANRYGPATTDLALKLLRASVSSRGGSSSQPPAPAPRTRNPPSNVMHSVGSGSFIQTVDVPGIRPASPPAAVAPVSPRSKGQPSEGNHVVVLNNQSSQQQGQQVVPVPVPTGGGGGGGGGMPSGGLDVGEVVNSFMKLVLLTNLSGS
jgi:hypothetical protein